MRRILLIAKRDFLASIKSKAFIFGLVVFPLLFGGGFIGTALMQQNANALDRRVAILDRTGVAAAAVIQIAQEKNERDLFDKLSGRQSMPRYQFEAIQAQPDRNEQRLALSERVRRRELFAFVEIGPEALHPPGDPADAPVRFYTGAGAIDQFQRWFAEPLNNGLRQVRLAGLGVDADHSIPAMAAVPLQSMNLLARDPRTGAIPEPRKKDQIESFAIPFALMLMLGMIVIMSASPMLTSVAEDKVQRVFEMLLGSATPFELIMGKVLAGVGRSLASSVFYIAGGILTLQGMALFGLIPFALFPWFFVYLVAEVTMLSALGSALGSACSSPQDAQQLAMILLMPVMIPFFLATSVVQQPNSANAMALSLFPLFTPMLMLLRQAMPGGVPAWQPWVGLAGMLACTLAGTWAAARIFRIGILFQGTAPKLAELVRWAVRG